MFDYNEKWYRLSLWTRCFGTVVVLMLYSKHYVSYEAEMIRDLVYLTGCVALWAGTMVNLLMRRESTLQETENDAEEN